MFSVVAAALSLLNATNLMIASHNAEFLRHSSREQSEITDKNKQPSQAKNNDDEDSRMGGY